MLTTEDIAGVTNHKRKKKYQMEFQPNPDIVIHDT